GGAVAAGAGALGGAGFDGDAGGPEVGLDGVHAVVCDQAEVGQVVAGGGVMEQVDDGVLVHAHGGEADGAGAPEVDALGGQAELAGVEGQAAFDVGDVQDDVIESANLHGASIQSADECGLAAERR